jgi:hypothetical protein
VGSTGEGISIRVSGKEKPSYTVMEVLTMYRKLSLFTIPEKKTAGREMGREEDDPHVPLMASRCDGLQRR